ncbi:sterile alpha motif domain-containing protein 12-like [Convolutriloba macropyga]|uniref:sterile alpha motif domain-containing protein 12-like n=1 Tax=Convolutriloba macropyga TaxID=536237 RepID=UPI003F51CED7
MVAESSVSSSTDSSSTSSAPLVRLVPCGHWSTEQVVSWLKRTDVHLAEKYADVFLEHDVNGAALIKLNDKTLRELGVQLESERSQLMHQIYRQIIKQEIFDLQRVMDSVQKENVSPKRAK